jgi:3D (Asp-Asp-Asp) domain-containing protein
VLVRLACRCTVRPAEAVADAVAGTAEPPAEPTRAGLAQWTERTSRPPGRVALDDRLLDAGFDYAWDPVDKIEIDIGANQAWSGMSLRTPAPRQATERGANDSMTRTSLSRRGSNVLPFGTRVRVTNLENRRSVVLTVNDRGPYAGGRIIDVSRRAAEILAMVTAGVVRVRGNSVVLKR